MDEVLLWQEGCEGDGRRCFMAEEPGGGVWIEERCLGPAALLAFGAQEYRQRLTLRAAAVGHLLRSLGMDSAREEDLPMMLAALMEKDGWRLVDFQDMLDAGGIGYAFCASSREGICWRPEGLSRDTCAA